MGLEDFLDLTLRELLDEYCAIYNLECGYYYGVSKYDTVDQLFEEYNIDEYSEAFEVENIVRMDILDSLSEELLGYDRLVRIMNNLGITRKE